MIKHPTYIERFIAGGVLTDDELRIAIRDCFMTVDMLERFGKPYESTCVAVAMILNRLEEVQSVREKLKHESNPDRPSRETNSRG